MSDDTRRTDAVAPRAAGVAQRAAGVAQRADPERTGAMSAFVGAMVSWLNERVAPPGVTIGADTALFENGLIDSMRILELIAWTERETGRTIADAQMRMDNFRTPRRIAEVFVER